MKRVGLRLQLRKQQAEAGDIVLLYGDESEALTHPYLARAWAKSGADLRVPAPGQAKKVAMLVFNAATPPAVKSLRHRRTVSSRTLKASAMRGLVHPDSVSNIARARSASPRSRELARARRPARCSSLAVTGDFPTMPYTLRIGAGSEPQKTYPLVSQTESA